MKSYYNVTAALRSDEAEIVESLADECSKSISFIVKAAILFAHRHESEFIKELEEERKPVLSKPAETENKKVSKRDGACIYCNQPGMDLRVGNIMVHTSCYEKASYKLPGA